VPDLQRVLSPLNHDVKEKDMNIMFEGIKRFVREEDGAAGVEYALLLTIAAVVIGAAAKIMSPIIKTTFNTVISGLGGTPVP
jgi:pilus assembly protein Flp/PilA